MPPSQKNNAAFWRQKLGGNKAQDALVTRTLRQAGWRVIRIWEYTLQQAIKLSTPHPNPLPGRGGEGVKASHRSALRQTGSEG
jgi:G:T-mismatch repair DNA endonuclease (very short patch repair protein)